MTFIHKKGYVHVDKTWISDPGPVPEDFPEEFDLDDLAKEHLEPDLDGMLRAAKQKGRLDETS